MSAVAVAKKLGGRKAFERPVTSDLELADAVATGFAASVLDHLVADLALTANAVYDVIGNRRTLQRKRADGTVLSPSESDRAARLARLAVRAEEVLGTPAKATRWLTTPNRALSGRVPLDLLQTDVGAQLVEHALGRIEHGVFS